MLDKFLKNETQTSNLTNEPSSDDRRVEEAEARKGDGAGGGRDPDDGAGQKVEGDAPQPKVRSLEDKFLKLNFLICSVQWVVLVRPLALRLFTYKS